MGRFKLEDKDKLKTMFISFKPEVYEKIPQRECKEIAEKAVLKEFKKR